VQRVRKRRSKSVARVLTSSSAKNTAKVKIKVEPEPADQVTCSTDDARCQSNAAKVAKCESSDDTLLPDTTTENVDDVRDDSAGRVATTRQSVINRIVDAMAAAGSRSVVPHLHQLSLPAPADVGQSYCTPYQHQYVNVRHAAPLYYHDEPAFAAGGRHYDDIDDVLSVMASVAGVAQPYHPHLPSNY